MLSSQCPGEKALEARACRPIAVLAVSDQEATTAQRPEGPKEYSPGWSPPKADESLGRRLRRIASRPEGPPECLSRVGKWSPDHDSRADRRSHRAATWRPAVATGARSGDRPQHAIGSDALAGLWDLLRHRSQGFDRSPAGEVRCALGWAPSAFQADVFREAELR